MKLAVQVCLWSAVASYAAAAQFTLTPVVVDSFTPAYYPIPGPPDVTTRNGQARIFQVDFLIKTEDLQPGERGFGNVGFSIGLSGLTEGGAGGWQPTLAYIDTPFPSPSGIVPLFSTNADAGPNPTDLKGIFVSIAGGISNPQTWDARVYVGRPGGPNYLGSVFVLWTANAPATLSVQNAQFSTYLNNGTFVSGQGVGGSLSFGSIPEPAASLLAVLGLFSHATMRRRS